MIDVDVHMAGNRMMGRAHYGNRDGRFRPEPKGREDEMSAPTFCLWRRLILPDVSGAGEYLFESFGFAII